MNPIDLIEALSDVSEEMIGLCFDDNTECERIERTPVTQKPMPIITEDEGERIKYSNSSVPSVKKNGSGILSHLLTAGCTAACIAGFTMLIRSVYSPNELYTSSGSLQVAVTQLTAATTTAATVPIVTTTAAERNVLETALSAGRQTGTEPRNTAETTAQFAMKEITGTEFIKAVTETVAASTGTVTVTTTERSETTAQTAEPEVQKPKPADDLEEKLMMLHERTTVSTGFERTVFEKLDGEQFGIHISYDVISGIVVYAEELDDLKQMIERSVNFSETGIEFSPYSDAEHCWVLTLSEDGRSRQAYFEPYDAELLVQKLQNTDFELLDILITDYEKVLAFKPDAEYCIQISAPDAEAVDWNVQFADYIDTEQTCVEEETKSVMLFPNDHNAVFQVMRSLSTMNCLVYKPLVMEIDRSNNPEESIYRPVFNSNQFESKKQ